MKERELRRTLAVFPIGSVMKLTDLTARQIRYYEDQGLIHPDRNDGNRRMYSLNDMDKLLEIKDYIAEGLNIAAIKREYEKKKTSQSKALAPSQVRHLLYDEIVNTSGFSKPQANLTQYRL